MQPNARGQLEDGGCIYTNSPCPNCSVSHNFFVGDPTVYGCIYHDGGSGLWNGQCNQLARVVSLCCRETQKTHGHLLDFPWTDVVVATFEFEAFVVLWSLNVLVLTFVHCLVLLPRLPAHRRSLQRLQPHLDQRSIRARLLRPYDGGGHVAE